MVLFRESKKIPKAVLNTILMLKTAKSSNYAIFMDDMKNKLQIIHLEPRWQINWQINQPKTPRINEHF